ncbi:MAG: hypothetical protein JXB48_02685 [Candidatus Latescibacteria bacterium]|nr:hypothetical protein [Candidatus Latescibacterota bacterium]
MHIDLNMKTIINSYKNQFKLICWCFILVIFSVPIYSQTKITEKMRKIINDRMDKQQLRYKKEFTVDCSKQMLIEPAEENVVHDFEIAKTPPTIKFMIIPDLEPEYFPEDQAKYATWSIWHKPTRTEDNKFYFAVGDHRDRGSKIFLYEYSAQNDVLKKILDVGHVLNWSDTTYTDGKIHGEMGLMPDGTLWAGTHFGVTPPDSISLKIGYYGSWLLSYNINTNIAKNWGVPLVGNTLPLMKLDSKRGKLFGTGFKGTVLCWDVINHKTIYADYPPNGWIWWRRACLLDEKTGIFWSTDTGDGNSSSLFSDINSEHHFISYNPENNCFKRHDLTTPQNPFNGKNERLRAYTNKRAIDGAYYCMTLNGALFKFWPEKDNVELICTNWDKGCYTTTLTMDSEGKYIYYLPGSTDGISVCNKYSPIVQYNIKTKRKKVLCWLSEYFYQNYGYWIGGTFGMEISEDNSFLVIMMNGAFRMRNYKDDHAIGWPSILILQIPVDERE